MTDYLDNLNALADTANNGEEPAPNRFRSHLHTGRAVLDIPKPGWLIQDVLPTRALAFTYGPPKSGKTFVELDQCLSVATGQPWAPTWDRAWGNGYRTTQAPVICVVAEGIGGLASRVNAWCTHRGINDIADMHWLTMPVNLTDTGEVHEFIELAAPIRPGLVVFDTLARCSLGAEENSARDMGKVVASADVIREALEATVMPIHHTGKDGAKGMRGSSALLGAADVTYEISRAGRIVTWACRDMKDAEAPRPLTFEMVDAAGSIALTSTTQATAVPGSVWEVRDALVAIDSGEGATTTAWEASTDVARRSFYRARKWLLDNGHVTQAGSGRGARYVAPKPPDE